LTAEQSSPQKQGQFSFKNRKRRERKGRYYLTQKNKVMSKNVDKKILQEMFSNMNLAKSEMELIKGGATAGAAGAVGAVDAANVACSCLLGCKEGCWSELCVSKGTWKGWWED
jgi:hypothetical protein